MFREDYPSSGGGGWTPHEPSTPEVWVPRWTIWDWIVTTLAVAAALALFLATCVTWSYTP